MFKVDDVVVNRRGQVCRIIEIAHMDIGAGLKDYFVLKPCNDHNDSLKFYIPVESFECLRSALTREEILGIINSIREITPIWVQNPKVRKVQFKELYDSGDPKKILTLIKSFEVKRVEFLANKKNLSFTDENFLKEIKKNLYTEFSMGLDISYNEVEDMLNQYLRV